MQAPEIDAATLNMLPDESREALLQRLLEKKLRCFATRVCLSDMHSAVVVQRRLYVLRLFTR